jgi:hypothetical protein
MAVALVCGTVEAEASAGFGCRAADNNIASLTLEGLTPRDGASLVSLEGAIEIVPGQKIEFGKADVVKFAWQKNIRLDIRKRFAGKAFVEIRIRTRKGEDEVSFPGSYTVRTETLARTGRVNCEGG